MRKEYPLLQTPSSALISLVPDQGIMSRKSFRSQCFPKWPMGQLTAVAVTSGFQKMVRPRKKRTAVIKATIVLRMHMSSLLVFDHIWLCFLRIRRKCRFSPKGVNFDRRFLPTAKYPGGRRSSGSSMKNVVTFLNLQNQLRRAG